MAEPIKVRVITKEEQEEKYKMIVYLFVVGFLIFLLYLSYNYIRTLGFNHNSAIALMISIPIILLICIFKGKKIYWSIKSLSQDNYHKNKYRGQNRKGFFWLLMIGLLILIVLFLQYSQNIPSDFQSLKEFSLKDNKNLLTAFNQISCNMNIQDIEKILGEGKAWNWEAAFVGDIGGRPTGFVYTNEDLKLLYYGDYNGGKYTLIDVRLINTTDNNLIKINKCL